VARAHDTLVFIEGSLTQHQLLTYCNPSSNMKVLILNASCTKILDRATYYVRIPQCIHPFSHGAIIIDHRSGHRSASFRAGIPARPFFPSPDLFILFIFETNLRRIWRVPCLHLVCPRHLRGACTWRRSRLLCTCALLRRPTALRIGHGNSAHPLLPKVQTYKKSKWFKTVTLLQLTPKLNQTYQIINENKM